MAAWYDDNSPRRLQLAAAAGRCAPAAVQIGAPRADNRTVPSWCRSRSVTSRSCCGKRSSTRPCQSWKSTATLRSATSRARASKRGSRKVRPNAHPRRAWALVLFASPMCPLHIFIFVELHCAWEVPCLGGISRAPSDYASACVFFLFRGVGGGTYSPLLLPLCPFLLSFPYFLPPWCW